MIIEQFVPAFHDGDAIGNSTLAFHRYLLSRGIESRIVALSIDPSLEDRAVFFKNYTLDPGALKILHFAIPSPLSEFFRTVPGKKVMIYHNITPSRFFSDFSADLVRLTDIGRNELRSLSGQFDLSVADSDYNASELRDLSFSPVVVFPIIMDLEQYQGDYSRDFFQLIKDERKNILFVGRITPNKKIEDLIKTLFFYKKYLSPSIRLIVAGNPRTLPKYFLACADLAARFHLNAEDLIFTGHIPFDELLALYHSADLFLSLSEHEGFCLPLMESCRFEVPVLAYAAGAIPETLGGAGVLIREKRVDEIAGLSEQIIENPELREKLKRASRERMNRYVQEADPAKLLALLKEL